MKKFLLIFFSCLLALSLLGMGAVLLYSNRAEQTAQTVPTTEPTTVPTTQPPAPVYQISMTLNGEQDIFLEYGESYVDPGATALLTGGATALNPPVEITGAVDITKVGTYVVTYTANAEGLSATVSRNVHIVDTQLPKITLIVDPYAYTLPGQPYKE